MVKEMASNCLTDVMGGCNRWQVKVHEHGFVALVDVMPRLVEEGKAADSAIVQAARVSYGSGTKKTSEDEGLIRYLMRNRHTTPIEMVEFKFHCAIPIFVARQWIRHRTASTNEYSARYSLLPDRFYRPTEEYIRKQSTTNKQGGKEQLSADISKEYLQYLDKAESLYEDYKSLVDKGVAREIARIGLPTSIYTEWYWKIDLHNLLHFLSLRADKHAQQEIQDYANAIIELIFPIVPTVMKAWNQYHPLRNGMQLTELEVESIKSGSDIATTNQRELCEWQEKKAQLHL